MRHRRTGAVILLAAVLFAACGRENPTDSAQQTSAPDATKTPKKTPFRTNPPVVATAASLERFDACPDLLGYLQTQGAKFAGPYGLDGAVGLAEPAGPPTAATAGAARQDAGAESAAAAPAQDNSAKSYSSTNVQERDVDEPDSIKTNGRTIFTTRSDPQTGRLRLVAIAADPKLGKLAGGLALPEGSGTDLLLDGDRLLVMGGGYMTFGRGGGASVDMAFPGGGGDGRSLIQVVDVGDPANMKIAESIRLEGSYASARMVGGVVRLVLNSMSTERMKFAQPTEGTEESMRAALAKNKQIAKTATLEQWLPRFKVEDARGNKQSEGPLATCDTTYRTKEFSGFQTTSVVTIDPQNPDPRNSAAVVGGAGTIYSSTDNLYIATQDYGDPIPVDVAPEPGVSSIAPVPQVPAKTSLHRFDIRDATKAVYAASGTVRGTILNQWSMSEFDGHLRVATTEDRFDAADQASRSQSFVSTLDARAGELKQVGQVGGLGKGERIYGVRMMGGIGYVVTFRQVDPLYVIDLSNPSSPKLLGELKIPGYSAYLHPVGEGLLLGIGQDADEKTGGTLGTLVSLFDVSDPANPRRIDNVRIDRGNSPVEWDHKAFTWWGPKNLAIIPVDSYGDVRPMPEGGASKPEEFEQSQTHVAIGFRIANGKITKVGQADQTRHVDEVGLASIQRSMVIGGDIYTLSQAGVMSSDLDTFDERGWVSLD